MALLGGQVDALASGPSSIVQQIKAGKLRALAHWGDKPLASLPDVPSLHAARLSRRSSRSGRGCSCRARPPAAGGRALRTAMQKLAKTPEFQQAVQNTGSPLDYMDSDAFARYLAEDVARMKELAKHIGRLE